ncbi:hypothetical protein [Tahibacter amnicola]|uniref:Uncharacterized protein n=1 Tax=Tahibacter amnicola TaxID=2976241 RepID=A0ABY6B9X9_9GAMM|nr:hypothetical protein [Tahibacter amnicola]UXI65975.1 hypothetical protein N4264_14545 [Tahibacter amnicola]
MAVSLALLALAAVSGAGTPSEPVCDNNYCVRKVDIATEPAFCARLLVPIAKDGALDRLWESNIKAEIASRLNNEQCSGAHYFPVERDEAEFVTPAIVALKEALTARPEYFDATAVSPESLSCITGGKRVHVSEGEATDEANKDVTATLTITGCLERGRPLIASLRSSDRLSMSGFFGKGRIALTYKHTFVDIHE